MICGVGDCKRELRLVAEFKGAAIPARERIYVCACGVSFLFVAFVIGKQVTRRATLRPDWQGARRDLVERAIAQLRGAEAG